MMNPLDLLITAREKFLAIVAVILIGIGAGWYLHSVWDGYLENFTVKTQLKAAQAVPGKLMKFHSDLKKTHAPETPCYNTVIPADTLKLLR